MQDRISIRKDRTGLVQRAAFVVLATAAVLLTVWSAAVVKRASITTPLAMTTPLAPTANETPASSIRPVIGPATLAVTEPRTGENLAEQPIIQRADAAVVPDDTIRWFDGRPARPVRTLWMRVTAYSPDARSCGIWADGQTATMHSVWTNGMRLVAADTRVLPFGSMISIPGYAEDEIVPVLDRGGAIKGMRLDVLYPTHAIARKWGVQDLPITVWEFIDE